jgi:hypothetical protein
VVVDQTLPAFWVRGADNTLTCSVYSDEGTAQTATAGTLSVYQGGTLLASPTVTPGTSPAGSAALTAATTSSLQLGTTYREVWTLTIGGTDYTFGRSAYLVRTLLYPVLTDSEFTSIYPNLLDMVGGTVTNLSGWRVKAWERLNRWLIGKGRRPELVLDSWALLDLHREWTRELLAEHLWSTTQDEYWHTMRDDAKVCREHEQGTLNLTYDADENGYDSGDEERLSMQGALMLNRPRGIWY